MSSLCHVRSVATGVGASAGARSSLMVVARVVAVGVCKLARR